MTEEEFNEVYDLQQAGIDNETILYALEGWFGAGAIREAVRDIANQNDLIIEEEE